MFVIKSDNGNFFNGFLYIGVGSTYTSWGSNMMVMFNSVEEAKIALKNLGELGISAKIFRLSLTPEV